MAMSHGSSKFWDSHFERKRKVWLQCTEPSGDHREGMIRVQGSLFNFRAQMRAPSETETANLRLLRPNAPLPEAWVLGFRVQTSSQPQSLHPKPIPQLPAPNTLGRLLLNPTGAKPKHLSAHRHRCPSAKTLKRVSSQKGSLSSAGRRLSGTLHANKKPQDLGAFSVV